MPSACMIRKHYIAKRCPYNVGVTRVGVTIYHRPYKRKKPLHGGNGRHLVPSVIRKT